jgi:HEAT repeat protein
VPLVRKPSVASALPDRADAAKALDGGTADERWHAVRSLENVPNAINTLANALRSETDTRVREAIFTALARIGSQESAAAVLPYVRSGDANLRTGALDALRTMIDAVRPCLAEWLADPDPDFRILVCDLAREVPSPEATSLLCGVLDRDEQVNVCAAAMDVLAEIGGPAALPSLKACAERFRVEPFLRFAAQAAIARIGAGRS